MYVIIRSKEKKLHLERVATQSRDRSRAFLTARAGRPWLGFCATQRVLAALVQQARFIGCCHRGSEHGAAERCDVVATSISRCSLASN